MSDTTSPDMLPLWKAICKEAIVGSSAPGLYKIIIDLQENLVLTRSVSLHESAHSGLNNRSVLGCIAIKMGHQFSESRLNLKSSNQIELPRYLSMFYFHAKDLHEGVATAIEFINLPRIANEVSASIPKLSRPSDYLYEAEKLLNLVPDFDSIGLERSELRYFLESEIVFALGASALSPKLSQRQLEAIENEDLGVIESVFDSLTKRIECLTQIKNSQISEIVYKIVRKPIEELRRKGTSELLSDVARESELKAKILVSLRDSAEVGEDEFREKLETTVFIELLPELSKKISMSVSDLAGYSYIHPEALFQREILVQSSNPMNTIAKGDYIALPPVDIEKEVIDLSSDSNVQKIVSICKLQHALVIPEVVGPFLEGGVVVAFHFFLKVGEVWQPEGFLLAEKPLDSEGFEECINEAYLTIHRADSRECKGILVSTGLDLDNQTLKSVPKIDTPQRGWGKSSLLRGPSIKKESVLAINEVSMLVRLDYENNICSDLITVATLSDGMNIENNCIRNHPLNDAYMVVLRQGLHAKIRWEEK